MSTDLRQPPLHAKLDDYVWKQWFQFVYRRILELDTTGGVVTSVTASSPLASSGGITPNISISTPVGVTLGGSGVATITGIIKGNGTSAFSAAVAGTDYVVPSALSSYAQIDGTPANNRIGVWTSASAIEGDANFLWNATSLIVGTTSATAMTERIRATGAILATIPTPGMASATDTETTGAVGMRIWTGGAWALDLGNQNGYAWIQNNTISAIAPSQGELILNPLGGNVCVGYTSVPAYKFAVSGDCLFEGDALVGDDISLYSTGARFVAKMTETNHADRFLFKTSTTNGATRFGVIPDGTGTASTISAYNASDPDNAANMQSVITATAATIRADKRGTGSYVPITIETGGSERVHVNTSGHVAISSGAPQSWGSSMKVLQVGTYTGIADLGTASYFTNNLYYNGTNWIYETTGATSGGSIMYFSNGNLVWYTAPTGGTAGNAATVSALAELFLDGSLSLKQASKSGSIFGSAADYTLNVNGTAFVKGLYSLHTNASEVHRDVSGSGAISSAQSALQVGLHSTNNADSISAGGGPSILFFGFDDANPPVKQFVGRLNGIFESGAASNVYGGVGIYVRTNNADTTASTLACTWKASKNMVQEGYTQLGGSGAPAIKMKKLTGTTNSAEGGTTSVAHGLTGTKIIGFTSKVDYAGDGRGMPTAHVFNNGYQYDCYHDTTNFIVANHATNSENILSKSFIITVWYEE